MTIYTISKEQHDRLLEIQRTFPCLTFQNVGFEYIDRKVFTEEQKAADNEVREILSKHIKDFQRFDNFRIRKSGEVVLRFQYMWDITFTGVGYLTVRELMNGFDNIQGQY